MEIHLDAATVGQLPARLATLMESPDDLAVLTRLAASGEFRVPLGDLVATVTARGTSAPRAVAVVREFVARWVAAGVVEHVGGGYRLADPALAARLVAASPSSAASSIAAAPPPTAAIPSAPVAPALPAPPSPGPEATSALQQLILGRAAPLPPPAVGPRQVVVLTGAQVVTDPASLTRLAPGDRIVIDLRAAAGSGTPTEVLPTATSAPPPTAATPPRTFDLLAAALAGAQAAPAPSRRTARRAVGRAAGLANLLDHLLHGVPPPEEAPDEPSPAVLVLAAPDAPPPDPAALATNLPPDLGVEVVVVDDDGAAVEEVLAWLGDGDEWTLLPPRA